MSFTIDDFPDLMRLLEEHPEWRAELRRQILTEELLDLPSLVRQLAEHLTTLTDRATDLTDRVDTLAARMTDLTDRVDTLAARMTDLTDRVDALAARVADLVDRLDVLTARVGALAGRVGTVEGELLELRYARLAPAYFSRLARRLRVVEPSALADLLDDAVQEGHLTEAEREAVLQADLVLTGRRREDQAEVYLLAEVSVGIGHWDVQRAADRAGMLARLGRPVVPVVAGRWINPEAAEQAQALGVRQVVDGQTGTTEVA